MADEKQPPLPTALTHKAITTFQRDGKWFLAEFEVNPYTGATGAMKAIEAGPTKDYLIEKFKLHVIELGLI